MSRPCLSRAPRPGVAATMATACRLPQRRTFLQHASILPNHRRRHHHHHHHHQRQDFFRAPFRSLSTTSQGPETRRTKGSLLTLAIESSCDDTCVAVLEKLPSGAARLHFNQKVTSDNCAFGGVHPPTAVASHTMHLAPLLQEALRALPLAPQGSHDNVLLVDGCLRAKPDFISVTRGPGMVSNLSAGLNTAKGLAVAWDVPLLAVNHMQAHALTPRLVHALEKGRDRWEEREDEYVSLDHTPAFPFLSLLVSGGHSLLVRSRDLTDHVVLAEPLNIAIGDMLDKCARMIVPAELLHGDGDSSSESATATTMYGSVLEKFAFPAAVGVEKYDYEYIPPAKRADEIRPFDSGLGWTLTPPLAGMGPAMAFDFSGINGQVQRAMHDRGGPDTMPLDERRLLARETMRVVFEHLVSRLIFALDGTGRRLKIRNPRRGLMRATAPSSNVSTTLPTAEEYMLDEDPIQLTTREMVQEEADRNTPIRTLVLAGGVASNRYLRHVVRATLDARGYTGLRIECPPPELCTDNAAMIAWAALEMYDAGWRSGLDVLALRKWGLDQRRADKGLLGAPGWVRRSGGGEKVDAEKNKKKNEEENKEGEKGGKEG